MSLSLIQSILQEHRVVLIAYAQERLVIRTEKYQAEIKLNRRSNKWIASLKGRGTENQYTYKSLIVAASECAIRLRKLQDKVSKE